jgi:polysaccharide biosynthesis/export protein
MKLFATNVNLCAYGIERQHIMLRLSLCGVALGAAAMIAGCAGQVDYRADDLADDITGSSVDYLVGPGDSLQIFVWDQPELSTNVQVRPDGKISTPLVEDLQAAGRSPTNLARDIEVVLSEYVVSPVVTVIVQGFIGETAQQIRVVGQAVSPRALQYRQGMRVLDLIIEVGGLSEFAAGNRAVVIRRMNGQEVRIRVRLEDLLNDGDVSQNMLMLPGDVLLIPESVL